MRINPFFMPILLIVARYSLTCSPRKRLGHLVDERTRRRRYDETNASRFERLDDDYNNVIDGLKISPRMSCTPVGNIPAEVPATDKAMKDLEKLDCPKSRNLIDPRRVDCQI